MLGLTYSNPGELMSLLSDVYDKYSEEESPHAADLCNMMDNLSKEQIRDIILYMRNNIGDRFLVPLDLLDATLTTQRMELCEYIFSDLSVGQELSHNRPIVKQWLKMAVDVSKEEGENIVNFLASKGLIDTTRLTIEQQKLYTKPMNKCN